MIALAWIALVSLHAQPVCVGANASLERFVAREAETDAMPLDALALQAGADSGEAADAEALAKKLSNPVASLISVPLQANYDWNLGANEDGERMVVNIQPVIPFSLNEDWNVISRTILPVIEQWDLPGDDRGIGDVVQSFFFSPKAPTSSGLIWGVGPVLLFPTASDDAFGADKWGLGPTFVGLKQAGPWTYGALANHIWSFAGDDDRSEVSTTLLQPFVSHTTPSAWSYTLNTESTYDWKGEEWSIPINAMVSKVTKLGAQLVSLQCGLRYWADSPPNGPEGLGLRFAIVFLFPK